MADLLVTYTADDLVAILKLEDRGALFKRLKRGQIPKPSPIPGRFFLWHGPVINALLRGGMPAAEAVGPSIAADSMATYDADDLVAIFKLKDRQALAKRIERKQFPRPAPIAGRKHVWYARVIEAFLLGGTAAAEAVQGLADDLPPKSRHHRKRPRRSKGEHAQLVETPVAGVTPAVSTAPTGPAAAACEADPLETEPVPAVASPPAETSVGLTIQSSESEAIEHDGVDRGLSLSVVDSVASDRTEGSLGEQHHAPEESRPDRDVTPPTLVAADVALAPPTDKEMTPVEVTSARGFPLTGGQRFFVHALFGIVPDGPFSVLVPLSRIRKLQFVARRYGHLVVSHVA